MKNFLNTMPIKRQLTFVMLLTSLVVLLLASGTLAAYESFEFRSALVRDMTALTDVLAKNTQAALAFQDETAARETLLALKAEPEVAAASLYTPDGALFSEYSLSPDERFPAHPSADGSSFDRGRLLLFRPVSLDGRRVGTIYLRTNLSGMYDRLRLFGAIAALATLGSILVALALSSRLQRPISRPILALAEMAHAIAQNEDYSVRAQPQGCAENRQLAEAFNRMLTGISDREKALRTANDALSTEVVERKDAEERARAQLARLELMNRITRAIGERQDLANIFRVVIRCLEESLPIDFGAVLLGELGEKGLSVSGVGPASEPIASELGLAMNAHLEIDEGGLSRCLRGQLTYEPDTNVSPTALAQRLSKGGLRAVVAAPLLVESKVFGALVAARRKGASFSSGECEFLRQLSEHVALASHQAQLHGALQQAYDDLRQTQQVVMQQERLRALGQMASGIAHDINNAISPVGLYTETLLETEKGLSARARDYLSTIQRSIDDVAHTVSRMREFYRQQESQLQLTQVKMNDMIQQVLDLSRARWSDMALQKGIVVELAKDLAPGLPIVMGIESEIREALVNLVFNAIDAMPEGGTLTLRTRSKGTHITVEVADTGVGMDEDTRRRCLEPFFTTKGERGTGLGLAMVFGIARRHQGEIEIDSAPGKGTTMRLIFPVPASSSAKETGVAPLVQIPSRLKILVVDDDPLLTKSLRDILEVDGHAVTTASSGQQGITVFTASVAKSEAFAVVITDLGMPYTDGRKVAAAVKGASPSTPVILLTGWGQRMLADGDIPAHVDRVLSKPPKLRELREALFRCTNPAPT